MDDPIEVMNSTCSAMVQFFTRADSARNRRADEAGPALLRMLRDLWKDAGPDALRDLEDGCERLLFATPDMVVAKQGGKGAQRGGRGGYRGGRRPEYSGRYRDDSGRYARERDDGYGPGRDHGIRYETYEPRQPRPYSSPQQRPAAAPSADHMDRCVYCNGEHLSQRCYTKFPNLRPPR